MIFLIHDVMVNEAFFLRFREIVERLHGPLCYLRWALRCNPVSASRRIQDFSSFAGQSEDRLSYCGSSASTVNC